MFSLPFDSKIIGYDANGIPLYDRASGSAEFARLLAAFLTDGVFGSGMFAVTAQTGMRVSVSEGSCVIGGRFGFATVPETLEFTADPTFPRIDSVVLRLDVSESVRNIHLEVHQGTPSSTPKAPVLTRTGTVWELGLANVLIPGAATSIAQERITDTRLDVSRCGIVAAVNSKIDTTALYNQIQADLAVFKGTEQAEFVAWFENIRDISAKTSTKYTSSKNCPYPDFEEDAMDKRSWANLMLQVLLEARMRTKPGGVIAMFVDWRQTPVASDVMQWAGWAWHGKYPVGIKRGVAR